MDIKRIYSMPTNNLTKLLVKCLLICTLIIFFNAPFSQSQESEDLKLILFNSSDCDSCQIIQDYLVRKKSGQGFLDFFYKGKKRKLTLEIINSFFLSKKDFQEMGLKGKPKIPYLGLFKITPPPSSKSLFIKGFLLKDFSEVDFQRLKEKGKKLGQAYFHIKEGEALDHYKERIDQFLELNIPLIERVFQKESFKSPQEKGPHNDPYPLSLEIGQSLNLNGKDLLKTNIIFIGNADHPFNNPLFTPLVIETIKKNLNINLNFNHDKQSIILFGSGEQKARDVFQITKKQKVQLISRPPHHTLNGSFNRKNFYKFFQLSKKISNQNQKRNLLIMVGHGTKEGGLFWFEKQKLKKNELKALHLNSKATNVMVSGTCFGGQFYDSVSCGFFGAHPITPAVGCWAFEDHIISQKDYTRTFFSSLDPLNKSKADFNQDGLLSFEEMHWHALLNGPKEDLPFTSLDGLARRFFRTHPQVLEELKNLTNFNELLPHATPGEKEVFNLLTKNLDHQKTILFEEAPMRVLKIQNGHTLSIKIDALNPFDSNTVFHFSPKDKSKIKKILKNNIQKIFKGGISRISFKKFGPKVLYYIFFKSDEKIKIYDNFKLTPLGKLRSIFFEIPLSPHQRKLLQSTKSRSFLISKKFSLFPKKWEQVQKKYLEINLLREFVRVGDKGKTITVGIRYKDQMDSWPKIMILGTLKNNIPQYRLALPQLLKRLFFKKVVKDYPFYFSKFKTFNQCEQQNLKTFLKNKSSH